MDIIIVLNSFWKLRFFVIGPILRGLGNTVDGLVGFGKGIIGRPDSKKRPVCGNYQI